MLHAPGGFVGRRSEGAWSTDQGPPSSRPSLRTLCRNAASQSRFAPPRQAPKPSSPQAPTGPGSPPTASRASQGAQWPAGGVGGPPEEPRGRELSRKFAGMPICGSVADFSAQGRARKGRKRQYDHAGASLSWQGSCALSCPPFRGRAEWTGVGPGASEKAWERTAWNSTKS